MPTARPSSGPGGRIELEPLEEVGYRALLQVQGLSGDRAAALQTYHRCVSVLERELGVAPDQATTAEYERLVARAAQEPAAPGPAEAPPIRLARPVTPARQARLVGRERELDLLCRRWQEALAGMAGFGVVAGEAGIGKTRPLDELASVVQRSGGDALRARCFAARGRLALAPVSERLRSPALRSARGRLDPVWPREVDRLVPPPDAGPTAPLRPIDDSWQRHRFFEGLARAVLVDRAARAAGPRRSAVVRRGHAGLAAAAAAPRPGPPAAGRGVHPAGRGRAQRRARRDAAGAPLGGPGHRREAQPAGRRALRGAGRRGRPGPRWGSRRPSGCSRRPVATRCSSWSRCGRTCWTTSTGRWTRPQARACWPTGSCRQRRPRARSRSWPRSSGATSRWSCSPKPATWTPTPSSVPWTSFGGGGSSASTPRPATTSSMTCCATPRTARSARPGAPCCTAAWPRRSSWSTLTISTPWPRSWPTSTSGPAIPAVRCGITSAPRRSRPGSSPTRRRSATTGVRPSCCRKRLPGATATSAS